MDIAVLLKMGPISKALCVTSAPLPPRYADAIALHLTLVKALPNINKSEHMRQAGIDEKQLRETSRYQKELRKAFQPINHRKTRYGILKVEDRSFTVDGQHFSRVTVTCIPDAIIDDPQINDDIFAEGGYRALDMVVTAELSPLVWQGYRGPGDLMVHEGDNLWEAMMVEITGEANEPLDAHRVTAGLHAIFREDGKFERRFVEVVKLVKAIHARSRDC
jgi:hypothetical protein